MHQNNSPWLYQLKRTRPVDVISGDLVTDTVVVGGGISGVMTSYFILKNTDRSVTLIEGDKVAHGATGHNAGQIVADFERELDDLVREYGLAKAIDAENCVRSAWILLEELYRDVNLATPLSSFMGYNGYKHIEHIIDEIKANSLRQSAGSQIYSIYIADNFNKIDEIPSEFRELYEIVPQKDILSLLETEDQSYVAAIALKKGCINSALLSEELVGSMLSIYKGRFTLFEHTTVDTLFLNKDDVLLKVKTNRKDGNKEDSYEVSAKKVILCTNGFERICIENKAGDDIDVKFHHMVSGDIGYMSAYVEDLKNPPNALGYYDQGANHNDKDFNDPYHALPYFYLTRRPYELENNEIHNLICIGGPEQQLEETQGYEREGEFSKEKGDVINQFVKKTVPEAKDKDFEYRFQWHGMMCYTPSNMRVVGPEPKNPVMMYNLGCNGVGILTSIHGSWRISRMLAGDKFDESIFDPKA